ncbi:MAG: hypothetical protein Q7T89_17640 [Anaerolineales bacterium]|nr:hypothetical protein [Anaerolineales bacterium]
MIRTMVQLTEEQLKVLKTMAKARKTSVARLVRESVTIYVATSTQNPEREKKRRRALNGLKKIKKANYRDIDGKTDVSTNHDQYLAEIYSS